MNLQNVKGANSSGKRPLGMITMSANGIQSVAMLSSATSLQQSSVLEPPNSGTSS